MKTITRSEVVITTSLILLIATISIVLFLSGCSYQRIEGNFNLTTEARSTSSFEEVISGGSFDVKVIPDSVTSIQIKAESNILPYLYTISDGVTLRVGFKNGYNIHENYPILVILHTPHARILRLQGSGRMEAKGFKEQDVLISISGSGNIDCDYDAVELQADISGSGSIFMQGSALSSDLKISGSGTIHSIEMTQNDCVARISGSGDIYTKVKDTLDVRISGSGCVFYSGDPAIESSISGSGKLIRY